MFTVRRSACVAVVLWALCGPSSSVPVLSARQNFSPPSHLELLVRIAIWNELQARKDPEAYFEYREMDWSPQSSTTSEQIETPKGTVASVVERNGEPLSPAERQKNARHLLKLAHSAKMQRSLLASQRQQTARRMGLLKDFPSAFLFQYEGAEPNGVVRLKFSPNPAYQPLSKEDIALRGMAGTMWIDPSSQRLVKINGTLVRDVTLGWGVVVRLYRGGHFVMEQAEVAKGSWKTTLLAVNLTGKILLVKNLHVDMKQTRQAFEPVASNLTVAQAVEMLRREPAR